MIFSFRSRHDHLSNWHIWFAWHPVQVGPLTWAWLQKVERKGELCRAWGEAWWMFQYRLAQ
jgi:hypothetical protein